MTVAAYVARPPCWMSKATHFNAFPIANDGYRFDVVFCVLIRAGPKDFACSGQYRLFMEMNQDKINDAVLAQ